MSDNPGERRQHPRFAIEVEALARSSDRPEPAELQTENLSLAGLCCSSTVAYPIRAEVAVRLKLPTNGGPTAPRTAVELDAIVVRREEILADDGSKHYRMALFFTDLEADALDALCTYFEGLESST